MHEVYRAFEQDSVTPVWGAPFFEEHLARYYFAQKFVEGKMVLELGCGSGYGARLLAKTARQILACDLNEKSIRFAQTHYSAANLEFKKVDVTSDFPPAFFDVVISLEVLEHLYPSQVPQYLLTIKKALKPQGTLILSTPNHEVVQKSGMPVPEFHIHNLSSRELQQLLLPHFEKVEIYGQARPMGFLTKMIYFLDRWNLRHSKWVRRWRKRDSSETAKIAGETWQPEQGFGNVEKYLFSKNLRSQAGMVVAVCSGPRL